MGYCIEIGSVEFKITKKKDKNKKIVDKLKKYFLEQVDTVGGGGNSNGERWYAWVEMKDIKEAKTIGDFMEAFAYEPQYDTETGDIVDLFFNGEKLGDDEFFFKTIAPYIEDGSYIEYIGEDNAFWKYVFKKGIMYVKNGTVVYED